MMLKASNLLRVGTALRGYLGLRGKRKVRGRRNRTVVRILRIRVPNGPLTTYKEINNQSLVTSLNWKDFFNN